ncbi:hypothetical protein GETHOR_26050 [Geothrix oryzae]|uniref:Uncharacterized protein n=1 Tax=Geothrix oryzae TaxID=2927975 RepID=A0ABN6V3N3_9BACT|nr:hypothetical protein [Geothrix oryzae]BDU70504.1 hypothetical protein GETHOR_26050 [Geothrix oryzae]
MAKVLRLLLAVLLGFVVGSLVNGGLILLSGKVIPPPAGADVTTTEGLKASLHLFEAKHFIFPFLAHALGTLSGAFVAGLLAPRRSALPAYTVGGLFLLGGLASVLMLPAPAWFSTLDLVLAYLPAAWLGQALAIQIQSDRNSDD